MKSLKDGDSWEVLQKLPLQVCIDNLQQRKIDVSTKIIQINLMIRTNAKLLKKIFRSTSVNLRLSSP